MRIALLPLLLCCTYQSVCQVLYADDALAAYYQVVELQNPDLPRRLDTHPSILTPYRSDSLAWNPWGEHLPTSSIQDKAVYLLPLRASSFFNSAYPYSLRDGALWKGKGLTMSLQGGLAGKFGILEYTLAPIVYYAQNSAYTLAPTTGTNHPYNYQFTNQKIDFVQRFGDRPYAAFDFGQSELQLVFNWFSVGVSTQNMIWGPALYTPILMGTNAAGIPRVEAGTHHPVATPIGEVELKFYWGRLTESDYFDSLTTNDSRYWSGASFGFRPSFLPSLCIGFHRSLYKKGEQFETKDLSIVLWRFNPPKDSNPNTGNDEYDQMGSFSLEWAFSEVGFKAYFEFAKNDFGGSLIGLEPEHGRGYTLGMVKTIELKNGGVLQMTYEHATLDRSKSHAYRGYNRWYSHSYIKQGYTQKGQIIAGGGIGPGAQTDIFNVAYVSDFGMLSVTGQRIRFDDDYFLAYVLDNNRHDQEWSGLIKYTKILGRIRLTTELGLSGRRNRYYQFENDAYNWMAGASVIRLFR